MKRIIFLHGFQAVAKYSRKLSILKKKYPNYKIFGPELEIEPKLAIKQINDLITSDGEDKAQNTILVGSSLGGFYAYYLSLKWNTNCLLINPSLEPFETLKKFIGPQKTFITGKKFDWKEEYINQLKEFGSIIKNTSNKNPNLYKLVLGSEDERLDYKKAIEEFNRSTIRVFKTNHRFQKFDEALKENAISCIFE